MTENVIHSKYFYCTCFSYSVLVDFKNDKGQKSESDQQNNVMKATSWKQLFGLFASVQLEQRGKSVTFS